MSTQSIDVVVPAYKDAALLETCVQAVLDGSGALLGNLIVIDDCSPEPEVAEHCRSLAQVPGVIVIHNTVNRGFVYSANEGMRNAGDNDVVLLNSDAIVPAGWLDRLHAVVQRHPNVASVTPFSNNATICSYPNFCEENYLPADMDVREVDALFSEMNAGKVVEIPTGVGFCMYLRRAAIDEVGVFDEAAFGRGYGEENDWCLRAKAEGWRHLLAADVFVYHAGGASFGNEASDYQANALAVISERYPDYERQIAAFIEADPMEPARYAVDTARPDSAAVISEYRQREQASRASRYELDRQRHAQVTALDELLGETREAAESERQQYEALLTSERAQMADTEVQYQAQLKEMAAGYQSLEASYTSLEKEVQELNRFWPVRIRRWLQRRLGG